MTRRDYILVSETVWAFLNKRYKEGKLDADGIKMLHELFYDLAINLKVENKNFQIGTFLNACGFAEFRK